MIMQTLHEEKSYQYGGFVSNLDFFPINFYVSMYKYIKSTDTHSNILFRGINSHFGYNFLTFFKQNPFATQPSHERSLPEQILMLRIHLKHWGTRECNTIGLEDNNSRLPCFKICFHIYRYSMQRYSREAMSF